MRFLNLTIAISFRTMSGRYSSWIFVFSIAKSIGLAPSFGEVKSYSPNLAMRKYGLIQWADVKI